MSFIKKCLVLLVFVSLQPCGQDEIKKVDFLIGTWKVEGRETYESWKKTEDRLVGESYKMKEGVKRVSESLEIKTDQNQIIYTATVFNQNKGKGIPFTLNTTNKEIFSFENPAHDFPNKIQYKILSDRELHVSVLGKDGKGFSYKMEKQ